MSKRLAIGCVLKYKFLFPPVAGGGGGSTLLGGVTF